MPPPPAPASRARDYDAFLSYTRHDRRAAAGIQQGMHRIGRRLGQLRALRVFRDDTDLTVSPDLWGKITDALDRSRFLVAVLSDKAAESYWVNREVSYWLERGGRDRLLLVLAGGRLHWDAEHQRFDPATSSAAVPVLTEPGVLPAEPFFIDVSDNAPWNPHAATLREKITALAAPIHGVPKDQLASDDLRERQRFRRLRAAAIAGMAVLTVVAVVAAVFAVVQQREAVHQRQQAVHQRDQAVALKLTSQAQTMLAGIAPGGDVRAIQQILAAPVIAPATELGALLDTLVARRSTLKIFPLAPSSGVMALSPDGRRIVSASDNTLRLWDAANGAPVGAPLVGHTEAVSSVAFTPDGSRIVSGGRDDTVRIWDAVTGAPVGVPLTGHTDAVSGVAVSPDGRRIVSGSWDKTVRLWDAGTGAPIGAALLGHTDQVTSVAFSPDGRHVASGSADNTARLWSVATGPAAAPPLTGHTDDVVDVAFGADGRRIATASWDGTVRLWDAGTGAPVGAPLTGHTDQVLSVSFSPDGQ
ncbi:MAG: TIR domain-containing protein, partial [Mycobacterium gordonae]|nr:TIR domain-containing protein [Mycobacterium gordonae]